MPELNSNTACVNFLYKLQWTSLSTMSWEELQWVNIQSPSDTHTRMFMVVVFVLMGVSLAYAWLALDLHFTTRLPKGTGVYILLFYFLIYLIPVRNL